MNATPIRSANFWAVKFFLAFLWMLGVCTSLVNAQTITTFDVLVATENLTVVGTTTVQGASFSVAGSSFLVNNGNVGIATAAPVGLFTVGNGTVTVLSSGFVGIGTNTPTGQLDMVGAVFLDPTTYPARFRWISSLGALRAGGDFAGTSESIDEDLANIGIFSFAFGIGQFNSGLTSTIAGGENNSIEETGSAFIGGGNQNFVAADSIAGAIVGGENNTVLSGEQGFIGGGELNTLSGSRSVITGGALNTASGDYSTIPGGYGNTASGSYSFAAGQQSSATAQGAFVWADSQNEGFVSTVADEFKIRARGGFVFYSTWTAPTVIVSSGAIMISTSASAAAAVPNIFISSANGNVGIGTANPAAALDVNGAGNFLSSVTASAFFGDGSHLTGISGGGSGGIPAFQVFNANGTFTVPAGVTKILVEVWGGGGSGGASSVSWGTGAGGGGGGGYGKDVLTVSPGDNYTVTVGGAGAASSISGTGGTISAGGGSAGTTGLGGYGHGGVGGTSTAAINITGATGSGGGPSGGMGGSAGAGGGGGGGGIGSTVALDTGKPGSAPGGGGGGSGGGVTTSGGGVGGSGRVIVMY